MKEGKMEQMDWYSNENSPATLAEVENLIKNYQEQRDRCEEIKEKLKAENNILNGLELKIISILRAVNKDSYKSNLGSISVVQRRSWKIPHSPEERNAFFEYLKNKGVYEGMVSVNSATLNSFLRGEFEQAEKEGKAITFKVPGISEPSVNEYISFRRETKK